ncbi:hypothetical protein [Chryseobacterium jejuense]|uniref:DNA topoisomerase-1 n=1 Tax=Chryseobacterium jejuense TaxID=445960 RepID=A0A2X2XQK7_CHRJE|nr:hypothetical protein [Chryseobacterium jejuense]SDJ16748.1 DNA topoisomerase-1 [Chryseobacterium jejuense]SQB28109.1 Uncharacterised protein [Chryseobacterium jejuense]
MKDPEASAKAVHLIDTTDAETAGITRKKSKKYCYIRREAGGWKDDQTILS